MKRIIFRSVRSQHFHTATITIHHTEVKAKFSKLVKRKLNFHATFGVSISLDVIQNRRCIIVECVDCTVRLREILVLYIHYKEKYTSIILCGMQPLIIGQKSSFGKHSYLFFCWEIHDCIKVSYLSSKYKPTASRRLAIPRLGKKKQGETANLSPNQNYKILLPVCTGYLANSLQWQDWSWPRNSLAQFPWKPQCIIATLVRLKKKYNTLNNEWWVSGGCVCDGTFCNDLEKLKATLCNFLEKADCLAVL